MLHCERAETLLPRLALEELDPERAAELEKHLADCAACRDKLADLRATVDLINEAATRLPAPRLSEERRQAIVEAAAKPLVEPAPAAKHARIVLWIRKHIRSGNAVRMAAAVMITSAILLVLLLPTTRAARERARRAMCSANLSQVSKAMTTYQELNGDFFPAQDRLGDTRPVPSAQVAKAETRNLYDEQSHFRDLGPAPSAPMPPGPAKDDWLNPSGNVGNLYPNYLNSRPVFRAPSTEDEPTFTPPAAAPAPPAGISGSAATSDEQIFAELQARNIESRPIKERAPSAPVSGYNVRNGNAPTVFNQETDSRNPLPGRAAGGGGGGGGAFDFGETKTIGGRAVASDSFGRSGEVAAQGAPSRSRTEAERAIAQKSESASGPKTAVAAEHMRQSGANKQSAEPRWESGNFVSNDAEKEIARQETWKRLADADKAASNGERAKTRQKEFAAAKNGEHPVAGDMDGSFDFAKKSNHENGQNVLYFDGHVAWMDTNYASDDPKDNIYLPSGGKNAGTHADAYVWDGSRSGEEKQLSAAGKEKDTRDEKWVAVPWTADVDSFLTRDDASSRVSQLEKEAARTNVSAPSVAVINGAPTTLKWGADTDAYIWDGANSRSATVTENAAKASAPEPAVTRPAFKAGPVNPWVMTEKDALSTFGLDVDTASYSIARNYILRGSLPPAASVRMEEYVNAFDYNYPTQSTGVFSVNAEAGASPFGQRGLTLLKIGVHARVIGRETRKPANLVFVVDASGSMERDDRMPLVKYALKELVGQLAPQDHVSVVAFGTRAMLALENVPVTEKEKIIAGIDGLSCGGSTNLFEGLKTGYELAARSFQTGGINRVILCSDGVANVGSTEADAMLSQVESLRKQGIMLTSVGFGFGGYDDVLLQRLADHGDGSYVFVDSRAEAQRVFVQELGGTLQTVAEDAKIQVAFDPARVRRYRLIGFEKREIADSDFRNDTVDAGEVGSAQSSTALYELELVNTDESAASGRDIGTVFVRYRNSETHKVEEIAAPLRSEIVRPLTPKSAPRFYLAACAAEFAEILRQSEHAKGGRITDVRRVIDQVAMELPLDSRVQEFRELVKRADGLPRAE